MVELLDQLDYESLLDYAKKSYTYEPRRNGYSVLASMTEETQPYLICFCEDSFYLLKKAGVKSVKNDFLFYKRNGKLVYQNSAHLSLDATLWYYLPIDIFQFLINKVCI